jgi:hypothetical protein
MVANDYAAICSVSTTHEQETLVRRVEDEGLSFLTITLPNLNDYLQKGMRDGRAPSEGCPGFKRRKSISVNPLFLREFMDKIFDSDTGVLLDEPNVEAIRAIRQLSLMFGKIRLACTEDREIAAFTKYIEIEREIRRTDQEIGQAGLLEEFQKASGLLFGRVLQAVDEDIYYLRITPKHGPGATADRLKGNLKYDLREWTERLESVFPAGEFLLPNFRYHDELQSAVTYLSPGAERPVRVIQVPKTLKTPRIIAIEPTCMQYAQQAISRRLVTYLESERLTRPNGFSEINPAFGYVGFSDQNPNREMARIGSTTGKLATLDLSEASDRVSNQLVRVMLRNFPHLHRAVDASRSRRADVPGHGVIRLAKFASMGSALTFPIEAMVFTTLAFMAMSRADGHPLSFRYLSRWRSLVRVYGDDIIVPAQYAIPVSQMLDTFGLKVNENKSYWTGGFRESCGKDYFAGHDVSVVRFREVFPSNRDQAGEIVSLVSFRNQMYEHGLWGTCKWLDAKIENLLKFYPIVEETSSIVGRHSRFSYIPEKWHDAYHTPLVRGWVTRAKLPRSEASGLGSLLKIFLTNSELPNTDKEHLLFGGRPESVSIKLRWKEPY